MMIEVVEPGLREPIPPVPVTQPAGEIRFAARVPAMLWPATITDRDDITTRLTRPPFTLANPGSQKHRARGLGLLLDWLSDYPGRSWQQRWMASGADTAAAGWRTIPADWLRERADFNPGRHYALCAAVVVAIAADVLRPSLGWLVAAGTRPLAAAHDMMQTRDPDGFTRLRTLCQGDRLISAQACDATLRRAALILAAQGGTVDQITIGDVLELLDTEARIHRQPKTHAGEFYQIR